MYKPPQIQKISYKIVNHPQAQQKIESKLDFLQKKKWLFMRDLSV